MLHRSLLAAVVVAAASLVPHVAHAQSVAPVKGYAKPGEPIAVRFLEPKNDDAKKALAAIGLKATDIPDLFTPAAVGDIVDQGGAVNFNLYTFDGKPVEAKRLPKSDLSKGEVDLAAVYPQLAQGGTYILTWKTATPLVINTLFSPGRSKKEFDRLVKGGQIPEAQRVEAEKIFAPTVTHITPLQYAEIKSDKGLIKATFSYDVAPHTVNNFISLASQKFYDGSHFHRIIKGFMIQGGDSTSDVEGRAGTGGPGYQIMAEFSEKKHERGTLSMARSQDPNSAGSQFFIMHDKSPHLDGGYTAFGQVIEGLDIVDKIVETPVSDRNGTVQGPKPRIDSVRILPATAAMYGIK